MQCDGDIFPTKIMLIQVLATLPVSVASAEKNFLHTWESQNLASVEDDRRWNIGIMSYQCAQ